MDNEKLIEALRYCARQLCGPRCPRYCKGQDGEECARRLMEAAATQLAEKDKQLKAAVEALEDICNACGWETGSLACSGCRISTWRGPQKAGEARE